MNCFSVAHGLPKLRGSRSPGVTWRTEKWIADVEIGEREDRPGGIERGDGRHGRDDRPRQRGGVVILVVVIIDVGGIVTTVVGAVVVGGEAILGRRWRRVGRRGERG